MPPVGDRLQCFPRDNWMQEFSLAAESGLGCIEWIYDQYGEDMNPLATDTGIDKIKELSLQYSVDVRSVCADIFIDRPLLRSSAAEIEDRMRTLLWLLGRCHLCGANRLVLPFVDASRIETDDEMISVIAMLEEALKAADKTGVEIHLETSLIPEKIGMLLDRMPHPLLKINYDSGNSAALGYAPQDEFNVYGDRVGSVHIKDRVRGGGTVPLGLGDTDFPSLFDCIKRAKYKGDFILQVARGVAGDEAIWAKKNRDFAVKYLND